jgi:hypothetical protein
MDGDKTARNVDKGGLLAIVVSVTYIDNDIGGPGSSVGIATGYGLAGPGIEYRWRRDFPYKSRPALGPSQPHVNRYRVFTGGRKRPGRVADSSLLLVSRSKNRVELYLYSS